MHWVPQHHTFNKEAVTPKCCFIESLTPSINEHPASKTMHLHAFHHAYTFTQRTHLDEVACGHDLDGAVVIGLIDDVVGDVHRLHALQHPQRAVHVVEEHRGVHKAAGKRNRQGVSTLTD